ncbi:MAG: GAF domain-containing protein [Myxococcota bacterium]|nr:GAF domain-containing protein [Myxococcota bacterium]
MVKPFPDPSDMAQVDALKQRVAELEQVVGSQEDRLAGLLRIAANLTSSREPKKAMKVIVDDISALMQAGRTTIYELCRDERLLRGLAVQGSGSLEVGIPLGRGVAGQVALKNRSINLKDAYQHPHFDPKFDKLTGFKTKSMLCVPMRNHKREVIGVVQVLNKADGYFTVEDERLLSALATQAAITLEALHLQLRLNIGNAELRDLSTRLRQKVHELELLYDNERAMAEAEEADDLAAWVLSVAARVVGCEFAGLYLPEESGFGPAWVRDGDPNTPLERLERVDLGDGVLGRTASRGIVLNLIGSAFEDLDIPARVGGQCTRRVTDALAVPLLDGDSTKGALALFNRRGLDHRDQGADEQLAVLIAGQMARAVERIAQRRHAQQHDRLMTIGQMLSSVLHDLKGPMTVISGYSQLMAGTDSAEERAEMSTAIRRQVHQFNDMTREVMAFVRGERRVFARKVYLNRFVKAVEEVLDPEFEGGMVTFTVENRSRAPGWFDERKMMRVITNIARNARQALVDGGEVRWVLTDIDGGGTEFRVQDNGPGIPEQIRDTLFDAFTTSGKPEGTGLGLAIVRRMVEDHGGSVSFTTATNQGTCFTIRLPGPPDDAKTTPPTSLDV